MTSKPVKYGFRLLSCTTLIEQKSKQMAIDERPERGLCFQECGGIFKAVDIPQRAIHKLRPQILTNPALANI